MQTNWNEIASELNYCIKNYNGLTKQIVQVRNRAHAYGIDPDNDELLVGKLNRKGEPKMQGLESIKGMAARRIQRVIKDFPIWNEWLENVPGIGPAIAGQLIALYYFRSIPVCQKCGADLVEFECPFCFEKAKGQGVLKFRVELRDYPTISSWYHQMGRHNGPDGRMPKRRKTEAGEDNSKNSWSSVGRKLGFDIRESFNKQLPSHKYKAYAEKRKRYRELTHPHVTKGHRHNMAWNEAVKIFLAHFWMVAHILDFGSIPTKPYPQTHLGHDDNSIIPPYYFNGDMANSHRVHENQPLLASHVQAEA